jgi:hypothetical protein
MMLAIIGLNGKLLFQYLSLDVKQAQTQINPWREERSREQNTQKERDKYIKRVRNNN